MSDDVDLVGVVDCLQGDALLSGLINVAPPKTIVMPFAKDRSKHYLIVAVFFRDENLRKQVVLTACRRIVTLLRRKYLAAIDGVEILISVVSAQRTERVLRLSILKESLDIFESMDHLDLSIRVPAAGMTSLMYRQIS
ncbi:hypothetical protein [Dyella mobilis]|uniref:Uncharacterized protein n=1 Tax=Dyella mobilis TaxID=1849582 RepID=A0ABS2KI12_9GAMM|nr:hypothetical protein [Dyella mobilis]MBM7130685.1 hypothetical protein [Dyella mobilis]GLQ97308.1 hypothetical protein GCM10007863_17280 [Dyella mobilis]